MNPLKIAVIALAATFALAACDDEAPSPPPAATLTAPATASAKATAPTAPTTATPTATPTVGPPTLTPTAAPRPPVEDCGTELRRQGATSLDDAGRDCLMRAYQTGTLATFTTSRPTIEGDPIVTRLEVLGRSDVRVTVDNTKDKFSAPANRVVRTYRCTTLAHGTTTGGLRPFVVSGCTDGASFEV